MHSERASEIDGDGRHWRADRQRERTKNLYGRDYRSGEGMKEVEMRGMRRCMQAMQHTTAATASVQCTGTTHRSGFSSAAQVRRRKLRLQNMSTGNTCGYISQSACVSMRGWGRRPVAFYYCISRLHSPAYPISTSLALLSFSVNFSNAHRVGGTVHTTAGLAVPCGLGPMHSERMKDNE